MWKNNGIAQSTQQKKGQSSPKDDQLQRLPDSLTVPISKFLFSGINSLAVSLEKTVSSGAD